MVKVLKVQFLIEQNKTTISKMLSGSDTHKRLNNVNWLRHELSYTELRTLFYVPTKQQTPYLDYNCMKNLGDAYDYIIDNPTTPIDPNEICKIHGMLCANTPIYGGVLRTSGKILDMNVNGVRYHAPDANEIQWQLNDIFYKLNNSHDNIITRAFNVHYDLIMLQPFDDFNKRTARLIMNWVLVQGGYRPIVFNKAQDKQKYREAIAARANGDIKAYTSYMYNVMKRTQDEIIKLLAKSRVV